MESTPWDPEGASIVLDAKGRLSAGGDTSWSDKLDLKALYKQLVAARSLDIRLSRMGLPMWVSSAGEEAPLVATAVVAQPDDWIYPGSRDAAMGLLRGMSYEAIAQQLSSDSSSRPATIASEEHRIATTTDALGMHLAMAAGQAHAQKLSSERAITFALFGEGTTTTGAFHETTALAVCCDLPLVLVCRSQLWPNGAPAEAGVVGDCVADRCRASGLWVRRVDGADPLAVHAAITVAAARARDGRGPALIDVVVTQLVHDPPPHRDPIERLRRHLDDRGLWTPTFQDVVEAEVRGRLDKAFEAHARAEVIA
jgi:TPP-dependent pyruvate/acetoin dehydrogenase alpha subunit